MAMTITSGLIGSYSHPVTLPHPHTVSTPACPHLPSYPASPAPPAAAAALRTAGRGSDLEGPSKKPSPYDQVCIKSLVCIACRPWKERWATVGLRLTASEPLPSQRPPVGQRRRKLGACGRAGRRCRATGRLGRVGSERWWRWLWMRGLAQGPALSEGAARSVLRGR